MSVLDSGIFTNQLSDGTLTLSENMGVREISVFNSSAVDGTVLGTQKLGGTSPSAITLTQGETFTVNAIEGSVLKNLTITSPSGCTLKIVAIV